MDCVCGDSERLVHGNLDAAADWQVVAESAI
jgi:hypothetical protein